MTERWPSIPFTAWHATPFVTARDPDAAHLSFPQTTYAAAAKLASWDRAGLDCPLGVPRVPRYV